MVQNNLEVTSLITPLINAFKALGNEWKELFDIGLREYLHNQTDKYYFTNTFLHRLEKVKFFSVYFPIKIRYGHLTTQFEDPKDVLEEYKYITIVGTGGSGKSTLVKYIFLNSLNNFEKIPVLIELRHLNEYNGDIEKLIIDKILKLSAKPSAGILERALLNGRFLFLLDGYDEIVSTKKQELNRQVELFVDTYPKNYFIITTRPGSGIEQFTRFHDFCVCNLSKEDVISFINLLVIEKERRQRIITVVKDKKNKSYLEYLQNPLLLSMFILTFESHPEIPKKKNIFYRNVFDTLYSKHDGITKNSFPRERKTKLQQDEFEDILGLFSYLTLKEGHYTYTEELIFDKLSLIRKSSKYVFNNEDFLYDLRTSISVFIKDGFEYRFPHRSMQEYFTAHFISKLPTEKKEKAYTSLTYKLKETSEDSGQNLWELSTELDFTSFTRSFVIPELLNTSRMIDETNAESILSSYLKLTKLSLIYKKPLIHNQDHSNEVIFLLTPLDKYYFNLIRFTKAYSFTKLFLLIEENPSYKEIIAVLYPSKSFLDKLLEKTERNNIIIDQIEENKTLYNILLNSNLIGTIKQYKSDTLEKVKSLEEEIEIHGSNIDDILGL